MIGYRDRRKKRTEEEQEGTGHQEEQTQPPAHVIDIIEPLPTYYLVQFIPMLFETY